MRSRRQTKEALFEHVAQVAGALASPKRLQLIDMLDQAPKPVELLAQETGMTLKLASAHLKALRVAGLVTTRRQGRQIIYSLASDEVAQAWVRLRRLAETHLTSLQTALQRLAGQEGEWRSDDHAGLLRKARAGEVIIIDVRPANEYQQAHLPYARSLPLRELRARLAELPHNKTIVAYCRGPYCLMSADAVKLLKASGYQALQLRAGVREWAA